MIGWIREREKERKGGREGGLIEYLLALEKERICDEELLRRVQGYIVL